MKTNFLLIALYFLCFFSRGQQTTIQFPDGLFPQENNGHSFAFLYNVKGNSVSTRFGVFNFKYPENFKANDTAYCAEYFLGYPGERSNGISILVANYKIGTPTLYIDRNNNLDFGDDDPPISFVDSATFFILRGKSSPKAQFGIKYWIENKDSTAIYFHDKMFNIPSLRAEGIDMISSRYWINTKRYENRITTTVLNGDSVKVALHDYNVNGRFDDLGKDMIYFGEPDLPFNADLLAGAITLDTSTTLFSYKNQTYKVNHIDPYGRSITVEPSDLPYEKPLGPGDLMPDLKLPTPSGDSLNLQSLIDGKHYLMIDLWADWCKPCRATAPQLKEFAEKYTDHLKLLGVSPHNRNDAVAKYTTQYEHNWTQALTTPEFIRTFMIDEYPRYILISPEGKIVSMSIYPRDAEPILSKS